MSNWFESNPVKTIITHTLVVAAAMWAIFIFIFDESKLALYQAQIENIEAEAREVQARNSVLSTRLDYVTEENERLRSWLEGEPSTIPFYEKKIEALETQVEEARVRLANFGVTQADSEEPAIYRYSIQSDAGSAVIDTETNVVIGVPSIEYGDLAVVNLTLPNGERVYSENVTAGETWRFFQSGKEYMLALDEIDWVRQRFSVSVIELGEDPSNSASND